MVAVAMGSWGWVYFLRPGLGSGDIYLNLFIFLAHHHGPVQHPHYKQGPVVLVQAQNIEGRIGAEPKE